jgi:hypothetical protein
MRKRRVLRKKGAPFFVGVVFVGVFVPESSDRTRRAGKKIPA